MVRLVAMASGVELEMADNGYELKVDGAFSLKPVDIFCCR
jgi:hypothetical protein